MEKETEKSDRVNVTENPEMCPVKIKTEREKDACFAELGSNRMLCQKCSEDVQFLYDFYHKCLRNKTILIDYQIMLSNNVYESTKEDTNLNTIQKYNNTDANISDTSVNVVPNKTTENMEKETEKFDNVIENPEETCPVKIKTEQEDVENYDLIHQEYYSNKIDSVCLKTEYDNDDTSESYDNYGSYEEKFNPEDIKTNLDYSSNENESLSRRSPIENTNSIETCNIKTEIIDLKIERLNDEQRGYDFIDENEPEVPTDYEVPGLATETANGDSVDSKHYTDVTENIGFNEGIYLGHKLYKCTACDMKFTGSSSFNKHMKYHSEHKSLQCDICNKVLSNYSGLSRHKRSHTGEKPYTCTTCNKNFSRLGNLNEHMKVHTGEKLFQCEVCKKKFGYKSSLVVHMRYHTGEKPFECSVCERKFAHSTNLKEHERTHSGNKPYVCTICEKRFYTKSMLNKHNRSHTGERPFSCRICHKKFSNGSYLRPHLLTHGKEEEYECKICHKTFYKKFKYHKHLKLHGEKKFVECEICNKKFNSQTYLNTHMMLHTGDRPFVCQVCNQRFCQGSHLKAHMRLHTGEKPHICEICQKAFTQASHLTAHKRIHSGEKPHQCPTCKRRFTQKSALTVHITRCTR